MEKEVWGMLERSAETLWMIWNSTCPSLRYRVSNPVIEEAKSIYKRRLHNLPPEYLGYGSILREGYMKEKHWIYAIFMAAAESLPLLYRQRPREDILHSILAKASLGASSKLLDNLNDEIHTQKEAYRSLENYLSALTTGTYEKKLASPVERAESSACEMASWMYYYLDHDAEAFTVYVQDCSTLVEGQVMSLKHKDSEWPSLRDYVESIAEKSIGDVWIDVDLCQFTVLDESLLTLKKSNEYIFKSSLVYDDVQDIFEDIQTKSVNSAVILGIERGIISPDDLVERSPSELVDLLKASGVLTDIVHLADALFLKGVTLLMDVDSSHIDMKGLLQSFRLVRLFNLRKLLMMNRDFWTLKQVLASFSDFGYLQDQVPPSMSRLVN